MNTQRYKWPVIIAAGLHGALFLSTPNASGLIKPVKTNPPYLPPIPNEEIIQMAPTNNDSNAEPVGTRGSIAPELPDLVTALPEKAIFTTPRVDQITALKIATKLEPFNGRDGAEIGVPGIGTLFVPSGNLDRQPRATVQSSPDYPATMRQQGITGSVVVEFDVNTEGKVVRAEVIHSTRREFAEPALRAVRNWRFEPGKRQGRAVPFRMTVPIEFGLNAD